MINRMLYSTLLGCCSIKIAENYNCFPLKPSEEKANGMTYHGMTIVD